MTLPWYDNPYGFATNVPIEQCHCTIARAMGMTGARRIMNWGALEPSEGTFNTATLAELDLEVQLCYANQINLTFVLDQAPAWANSTFHNTCSNIDPTKALNFVTWLLNRYNGGGVSNAMISRLESGNEGYSDKGPGTKCQTFENAVPVLQNIYPWIKSNYPDVLVGMPAHFNRKQTDILSTHATLYTGFYGSAAGYFDYGNYHWYGAVNSNGLFTGPDGPQKTGNDTFNQEWQDIHSVDVAHGNGTVPIYCTETGMAVPGGNGTNTEPQKAIYFAGGVYNGVFIPGIFRDGLNSGGILTHVFGWTIQDKNGYSFTEGCGSWTPRDAFGAIQNFINIVPQWVQYAPRVFGGAVPYIPSYYIPSTGSAYAQAILADGPMAYYRLDEVLGTTAHDVTGNGYDGTYTADTTLGETSLLTADADTSMLFTAHGTLTIPPALQQQIPTWTGLSLEFWIQQTSGPQYVAVTTNDSNTLLYLNGVPFTGGSGDQILIGSLLDVAGSTSAADLDEVALYNKPLTPAQIANHYQIGSSGVTPEPGELLYLPDYFVAATDNNLHQYGPGVLSLDPEGRVTSIGGIASN